LAALGTRPADRMRSRLGLFRGGILDFLAETNGDEAPSDAGPIERAFFSHSGRVVHKWHHYLPLYDHYFESFRRRERPVRLLEIGVAEGGSLQLWRGYFGPKSVISGIDINPACGAFDGEDGNRVRIGSQADPKFLRDVVGQMGGVDIVIDDGSHENALTRASFDTLFPLLSDGGLYVVEDLHTSYWRNFGGGYYGHTGFLSVCKRLIDDIHHWYHPNGQMISAARDMVGGIHFHDSIVFIDKKPALRPVHSHRGGHRQTGN
jgi:hypothetical protein